MNIEYTESGGKGYFTAFVGGEQVGLPDIVYPGFPFFKTSGGSWFQLTPRGVIEFHFGLTETSSHGPCVSRSLEREIRRYFEVYPLPPWGEVVFFEGEKFVRKPDDNFWPAEE